jgi:hypothetical protein
MFASQTIEALDDLPGMEWPSAVRPSTGDIEAIPARLDEIEPGPFLAAILAHTDVGRLTGHDRIVFLRAQQRMASHYNAGVYRSMTAVTEHMRGEDEYEGDYVGAAEAAAVEIRAALRMTRRATDSELSFALELRERIPRVWDALARGDIDVRRAKVLARHTSHLTVATARGVVDQIITDAPHLTTGQLAEHVKELAIEANPAEAEDRYHHTVDQRRVVAQPTVAGAADLAIYDAPPDRVAAAMRRINHLARSHRRQGETRTMDQLRADVALDLLMGQGKDSEAGPGRRGVVDLTVDLATLAGLTESPGDLRGFGPVIAEVARRVADQSPDAEWRFTVGDSASGQPIGGGLIRRRPEARDRRLVEARDRTCVFPGCRMPASVCDIDHITPHAEGGPTAPFNNAAACEHDHRVRHRHGWTYRRLPDGDYVWKSRLGHLYTTSGRPPSRLPSSGEKVGRRGRSGRAAPPVQHGSDGARDRGSDEPP